VSWREREIKGGGEREMLGEVLKREKRKEYKDSKVKTNEEKTKEQVERKETEKEIQERAKAEVRVERVQACWLSRKNFGTISQIFRFLTQ
jgi:hypothetical protein